MNIISPTHICASAHILACIHRKECYIKHVKKLIRTKKEYGVLLSVYLLYGNRFPVLLWKNVKLQMEKVPNTQNYLVMVIHMRPNFLLV